MRAGNLSQRVTLQQLTAGSPTQNAGGEVDEEWTDLKTVWAEVSALKGRELLAAQQVASEVTGTIRIRYRSGITAKMRATLGSRVFDILAVVDPKERNRELLLHVREGTNNG